MNDQDKKKIFSSDVEKSMNSDSKDSENNNPQVDAIKTGKKKKGSTQDQPADEQMYESFDELREEERLNDEE